ncbi:transketolase [Sphingobium sp.]|uniref:transketolase n=1 Tax=Sphingobium sp. TaxID=1912891 RepID=UPI0028BD4033|nr:transketolase [Sphingobium sp.]
MTRNVPSVPELEQRAQNLRRHVVRMIQKVKVGYLLQGLGAADLFAALYLGELRLDADQPNWFDRDRLLLSTAHNTAIFYAAFVEAGLIPPEALGTYTDDGSPLEVNASERLGTMVEATCGSLGQGLSVAIGMALTLRRRGSNSRVYVVLGDGELQEGQVWEAALSAGGFGLDNLCMIIDRNYLQVEGHTDQVVAMDPIGAKFEAFGWNAIDIDGNNMADIVQALDSARATKGAPTVIVAEIVPGAGIPFLEGQMAHVAFLSPEDGERALAILEEAA